MKVHLLTNHFSQGALTQGYSIQIKKTLIIISPSRLVKDESSKFWVNLEIHLMILFESH